MGLRPPWDEAMAMGPPWGRSYGHRATMRTWPWTRGHHRDVAMATGPPGEHGHGDVATRRTWPWG